jgi:hypothetical protein
MGQWQAGKWYSDCKEPLGLSPVLPTLVSRRHTVMEEPAQGPEAQHSIQSTGEDHAVLVPEAGWF